MLEILYEDEDLVLVNKPAGMLVHRSKLAGDIKAGFAVQVLREQINQKVYLLHRIDRPTSGILMFAKSSEVAGLMRTYFDEKHIEKYYLTLVRGYMKKASGTIDYPLKKNLTGSLQEAQTSFWQLNQVEIPLSSTPRYDTSRYSLVKAFPHTGRMHQIRRHFAHERNYIIGDSTHGETRQNRFFRINYGLDNLLLHAWQVQFNHPLSGIEISIQAPLPEYFLHMIKTFGWEATDLS
ncbi:pseudouridine synthase [Pararhodonellum marinum]|uniref:pseudouridine synthase n=1 Tax=Pararhodonellum marinum TaxID=2755358 RepID=UPI00188E6B58|nr:pseudouridine synthase [Pararhodonellum marinum]